MRKIDLSESPMPDINPSKVYFIIEMAHEYQSEDVGVELDASSRSGDGQRIMLTDASDHPTRRELIEYLNDLDVDESAALVALA